MFTLYRKNNVGTVAAARVEVVVPLEYKSIKRTSTICSTITTASMAQTYMNNVYSRVAGHYFTT